jgi:putative addiction module killer protein
VFELRHYLTRDGKDPIDEWLRQLRDGQGKAAIIRRLNRLEQGNFGDFKPLRDGVHELRIDVGPGYRVYYAAPAQLFCCCFAAERSGHSVGISTAPAITGAIGRAVMNKG